MATTKPSRAGLTGQAYIAIRERILRGQLALGAALSRRRLAEELGMSMLPISEAVQRLEAEGLLESRPQVGTRVRVPSEEDVRGRFIVREALESQSARLFAERAGYAQRQELCRMAEHVDALFNQCACGDCDPAVPFCRSRLPLPVPHEYRRALRLLRVAGNDREEQRPGPELAL